MKQSKFFSVYILIHCIILALVVGMAAAAFSMSNGLLLLENPTTATTSANSRAAMVGKVEATKDKIKKSIKPVVGGCEIWDTGDRGVIAGYFRAKRWGVATTTADNLLGCDCPTGTNKILIYSGAQNVTTMANPADEWRFKYNLYLTRNYPLSYLDNWDSVALSPVCVSVTGTAPGVVVDSTSSRFYSQRANLLVANATYTVSSMQTKWVREGDIPGDYAQHIGYCFVYHGISPTDGNCCCDTRYCYTGQYNPPPATDETPITDLYACYRAQTSSQYYGIARDNLQWSTIHNPEGGWNGPLNMPSGCGLVVYNHKQTSTLPSGATTSVQKWVCVSNTDEGWDNNWGLP